MRRLSRSNGLARALSQTLHLFYQLIFKKSCNILIDQYRWLKSSYLPVVRLPKLINWPGAVPKETLPSTV